MFAHKNIFDSKNQKQNKKQNKTYKFKELFINLLLSDMWPFSYAAVHQRMRNTHI